MTAEALLKQGQDLREQGQTLEALDLLNQALDAFARDENWSRFAHTLLDRAICWQHLYQFHDNHFGFATLYKKDAEAMLEIVEQKNIEKELAEALFMNAKAHAIFGEYEQAAELFIKAIANMSPDRKAQKGDWTTNLGKSMYLAGQKKQGLQTMLEGLEQIKKYASEVSDYEYKIWLTGGLIRLAEVLKPDRSEESQKYLNQAKQIIESDPKLTVRQKQLETYLKTGLSGL